MQNYFQIVEEAIEKLGLEPVGTRGNEQGQWNLKKGNFDIMIDVWTQENKTFFQILCPLCIIPPDSQEDFHLHLLKKNFGLCGLAYSIMDETVFLKYTIEAEQLTMDNIYNIITKTAFYAEQSEFVPHQ
jgi:hypothetical protein